MTPNRFIVNHGFALRRSSVAGNILAIELGGKVRLAVANLERQPDGLQGMILTRSEAARLGRALMVLAEGRGK